MKLAFALSCAALLVSAHGDHHHHHDHDHDHHDHDHHHDHGVAAATAASASVAKSKHPVIPQTLLDRIDFLETFQQGQSLIGTKWQTSTNPRYSEQEWSVDSSFGAPAGFSDEQSLSAVKKHKHYGLVQKFDFGTFDNKDNDLVFQYEVRFHAGEIGCSGAYIKLLRKFEGELNADTPYVIMFGPDKCGNTNKVHLIIQQKQPSLGIYEEKHLASVVLAKTSDALSHLYTLVIRKDNTFSVLVDEKEMASGSLLTPSAFNPSFGAAKEIDDPTDTKPADWVEEARIRDPLAVKPEDWDEDAPQTIVNPDAKQPEDWNEEEDGVWEASHIPNPNYRGKWTAPLIDNPDYKGEWKPRRIPNPHHFVDETPSNLEPIEAIAFEILVNDGGIAFDNLLLTHDEGAAKEFAALTFRPKQAAEIAAADQVKKAKAKQDRLKALEENGVTGMLQYVFGEAGEFIQANLYAVVGSIFALIFGCTAYVWWFTAKQQKPSATRRVVEEVAKKEDESEQEEEEDEEEEEEGTKAD